MNLNVSENHGQQRTYRQDREMSDVYLPRIKEIVGAHLLTESSFEVDTQQATDLVVLTAKDMTIAARMRFESKYWQLYPGQFTIRSRRDNGFKTELAKVADGWGDWLFYGHADPDTVGDIAHWYIIDLNAFRAGLIRHFARTWRLQCGEQDNRDGTHFGWYMIASFPPSPPILIATSEHVQGLSD